MIEAIMYVGLGFLTASLLALVIIPLIHDRAVRLTLRRLNATMPASMAEIQAEQDQMRAEFAMSTRRLEIYVDHFRAKAASQLAELRKNTATINRLKAELAEKADVNRRGLRPTIGVPCGPSAAAYKPFVDNLKMPPWVGPSWAPMWVKLRGRFTDPSGPAVR